MVPWKEWERLRSLGGRSHGMDFVSVSLGQVMKVQVRWYHHFLRALDECFFLVAEVAWVGVLASLSSRAVRSRAILTCRCCASSSIISLTTRVVLSIGVSGRGSCALNRVVFVSFANDQSPLRLRIRVFELSTSNRCQVFACALDVSRSLGGSVMEQPCLDISCSHCLHQRIVVHLKSHFGADRQG